MRFCGVPGTLRKSVTAHSAIRQELIRSRPNSPTGTTVVPDVGTRRHGTWAGSRSTAQTPALPAIGIPDDALTLGTFPGGRGIRKGESTCPQSSSSSSCWSPSSWWCAALISINVIGPAEVGLVRSASRSGSSELTTRSGSTERPATRPSSCMRFARSSCGRSSRSRSSRGCRFRRVRSGSSFAQVGAPLPIGAKSVVYRRARNLLESRGLHERRRAKGCPTTGAHAGTLFPIHPVAFLVMTSRKVFGLPVPPDLSERAKATGGVCATDSFGFRPSNSRSSSSPRVDRRTWSASSRRWKAPRCLRATLRPRRVHRHRRDGAADRGASRHGSHRDACSGPRTTCTTTIRTTNCSWISGGTSVCNTTRCSTARPLNPFLVRSRWFRCSSSIRARSRSSRRTSVCPLDTSGVEFNFGSIVRPGHRGIWAEPLRTGKYPINPRVYAAEIVPTAILTLNWAEAVSTATPRRATVAD